jgi:hypothetical protein
MILTMNSNRKGNTMETYGDWKVTARHSAGQVLRVWVEHVRTGERKFLSLPVGK